MAKFFAPYVGKKPAALSIKGHRLLLLTRNKAWMEESLDAVGGDRVRSFSSGPSRREREDLFERLARQVNGGVVLSPPDTEVVEVIRNLESELPWLQ
jgi:hypothetical protein